MLHKVGSIYRHIPTGVCLRLKTVRESNINTFIDCCEFGKITYKPRCWAMSKKNYSQERLVKGFKNLIKI